MKRAGNGQEKSKVAGVGWKPIALGAFIFLAAMLGMVIGRHRREAFHQPSEEWPSIY